MFRARAQFSPQEFSSRKLLHLINNSTSSGLASTEIRAAIIELTERRGHLEKLVSEHVWDQLDLIS